MSAEIDHIRSQYLPSRRLSPASIRNLTQIIDSTVIIAAGFAAYSIFVLDFTEFGFFDGYCVAILMGAAIGYLLLHLFGAYERECLVSRTQAVQRLLGAWATTFASLLFIAFLLQTTDQFSRAWAVTWLIFSGGLLIAARLSLRDWIQRRAVDGALAERSVIFGAGEFGQRFADQIGSLDDPFIKVMGFIDDRTTRLPQMSKGVRVLGNSTTMLNFIRAGLVDHVYIALPLDAHHRVKQVVDRLAQTPVRVSLVSSPLGFDTPVQAVRYINKSLTIQVFDHALTGRLKVSKWFEDRLIAVLALILTAPLMAAIAIALRCESAGPVFVRQRRFGFNDNPIDVWKFRTTRAGAPARAGSSRQAGKAEDDASPLGRLLEKCGFDELPQLVNVLLGDMSIVGPRPRRAAQADKGLPFQGIIERYAAWHQIKPGITGLAQIKGHYEHANGAAKLKKEIEHDLHYIENWSVFLDFWIILRTAVLVFKDRTVL